MYRSYYRRYSDIKSDLNNYLNENIFVGEFKYRKSIKLTNLVPYPIYLIDNPMWKYRVYILNELKHGDHFRFILKQMNLKNQLLVMEHKIKADTAPIESYATDYLESVLNELKAGNYTYDQDQRVTNS